MAWAGFRQQHAPIVKPSQNTLVAFLNRPILLSLLLVGATVALYYPVHRHPFINYDDNEYVYENPHVESGLSWRTVKWAMTTSTAANWHPITWLSHAADYQVFGANPAGHHDMNVLFHVVNVLLLFWVLLRATGYSGRSFMVAALFALHPINVESVAWVAERKTMLSMMFFLLALGAYRWYAQRPRLLSYAFVAVLFGLGLMAKPQIITFPFVLLLWDYWPLRRLALPFDRKAADTHHPLLPQKTLAFLVVEKLPLFIIAAASAVITMHAQHGARSWYPHSARAGNAILSYGLYIKKALWPSELALLYPHPGTSLNWTAVVISGAILCVITTLVLVGRRHRYLPVGWFWFLGTLIPMMGIVQVGVQGMADRYAYVSFLGLFILICWGVTDWAEQRHMPGLLLPLFGSVLVLIVLALVARRQIDYWGVEETLWQHTLQVTTRNYVAEGELGATLAVHGKIMEAMPHFDKAVALNPNDVSSNLGLAIIELQQGNFYEALTYYKVVVRQETTKPVMLRQAYLGMSKAYRELGDRVKSEECLLKYRALSSQ